MDSWVEFDQSDRAAWPLHGAAQIMLFDHSGAHLVVDDRSARYRALAEVVDPRS